MGISFLPTASPPTLLGGDVDQDVCSLNKLVSACFFFFFFCPGLCLALGSKAGPQGFHFLECKKLFSQTNGDTQLHHLHLVYKM